MADRYWVGGSGNWSDNTNHWAATSGGAPGASKPTTGDVVIFDTLSNATGYTLTFDEATAALGNLTFGAPLAGVLTTAGSGAISFNGNLTVATGTVWGGTGSFTLAGSTATTTIDTNNVDMKRTFTMSPTAAVTYQMLSHWKTTFNGNGWTFNANATFVIAGTAGTRSFSWGSGTHTFLGNTNNVTFNVNMTGSYSGVTWNAGTSTFSLTATAEFNVSANSNAFDAAGFTFYNIAGLSHPALRAPQSRSR